ncbi:MAG: serine O-acetyltransferase, partial [Burkholderiales bacterium]
KILGPLLIGDGARIGSNAVVVKDVPANATAVGIPARVLSDDNAATPTAVKKLGFTAYAISADMNDPMVKAVHGLIDHSAAMNERLDWIVAQLKAMGVECSADAAKPDEFDREYLNKIVD